MSLPVLHIVHQRHSSTGRVGKVLSALGHEADVRRPSLGEALPSSMDDYAGTVVFGGPMSVNDDEEYLRTEMKWLETAMDSGKPVLGICLGGQMLTKVLSGTVSSGDNLHCEIGWYPVYPANDKSDFLSNSLHVYQWHSEGMTLPKGAELLATGRDVFPVQAWRYRNGMSLQFHPEVTEAVMRRWVSRALKGYAGRPGVQMEKKQYEMSRRHTKSLVSWTRGFLSEWIAGKMIQST